MWGAVVLVTGAGEIAPAEVVREKDDDVRAWLLGEGRRG
jgi:hypothetical protein